MNSKKVIYYKDELNDEFSNAKITPRKIDENYKYKKGKVWNAFSLILQNALSMPIKLGCAKMKFKIKYVGKEKLKECKNTGYFVYGNHTQIFGDTFIPSLAMYPRRNFFIVNPENISIKPFGWLVEMLGAIPVPGNKTATKNFLATIKNRIDEGDIITIYPEAHIWPYYTKIRPFKAVSFKYPVELDKPVFCITNTYQRIPCKSQRGISINIKNNINNNVNKNAISNNVNNNNVNDNANKNIISNNVNKNNINDNVNKNTISDIGNNNFNDCYIDDYNIDFYNCKFRIVTYIDGPFYANSELPIAKRKQELRDRVYAKMVERSANSDFEFIKYIKS